MRSIWYRKRAIPLAWICLSYGHGTSHYRHGEALLDYLETLLADDMMVIILADREFGSTVFLLTLGRQLRLHQRDLEITSPAHRRRLSLFPSARRWLRRRMALDRLPPSLSSRPFWQFV